MDLKGIAYAALTIASALSIASQAGTFAQIIVLLISAPFAFILLPLLIMLALGAGVVFLVFYLNYAFQKKLVDSVSVEEGEEVSE